MKGDTSAMETIKVEPIQLVEMLQGEIAQVLQLRNLIYYRQAKGGSPAYETANRMGRHIGNAERMADALLRYVREVEGEE